MLRIGVAIVPGVGDRARGDTVDEVVEGLCARNRALRLEASGSRVPEGRGSGEVSDPKFVISLRRVQHRSGHYALIFSELFWGDVSPRRQGVTGLLRAVGSLLMGLHALVFAGGGIKRRGIVPKRWRLNGWPYAAYRVSLFGAYHIKGVVIPLASVLLLLGLLSIGQGKSPPSTWIVAFSTLLAGFLTWWLPVVKPTMRWGSWCLVGYVVPISWLLVIQDRLPQGWYWVPGVIFTLAFGIANALVIDSTLRDSWSRGRLRLLRRVAQIAFVIPWAWWALARIRAGSADSERDLRVLGAVLETSYHVALGFAALLVLLVFACYGLARLEGRRGCQVRRARVVFLGYGLECCLWIAMTTALFVALGRLPAQGYLEWLGLEHYERGTWLQVAAMAFPLGLVLSLWLWRGLPRLLRRLLLLRRSLPLSLRRWVRLLPRLLRRPKPFLIADLARAWPLTAVTILTALAYLAGVWSRVGSPRAALPPGFVAEIAALGVFMLVALLRQLREPLLSGLDLANDVTAYFRGRSWASQSGDRTDAKLKQRFKKVLDDLVEREECEALIIVSHSQGTVFAAQALLERRKRRNGKRPPVQLLTLGSPLPSLYAEFFPHEFRTLAVELDGLPGVSWSNLYRRDDLVGRSFLGQLERDRMIPGTGHTDYWIDHEVLDELEDLVKAAREQGADISTAANGSSRA